MAHSTPSSSASIFTLGMSQNKAITQTSVRIRFLVTFHMETALRSIPLLLSRDRFAYLMIDRADSSLLHSFTQLIYRHLQRMIKLQTFEPASEVVLDIFLRHIAELLSGRSVERERIDLVRLGCKHMKHRPQGTVHKLCITADSPRALCVRGCARPNGKAHRRVLYHLAAHTARG